MSSMTLPYREPLVARERGPRQIPEPPRRGEPAGPPCGICTGESTTRRAHVDSFSNLPEEPHADFGRVAARVERAILALGEIARVHLCSRGDGGAHFHVWFHPRPLGMLEASGMALPLWADVLPNVPDEELAAAAARVAASL